MNSKYALGIVMTVALFGTVVAEDADQAVWSGISDVWESTKEGTFPKDFSAWWNSSSREPMSESEPVSENVGAPNSPVDDSSVLKPSESSIVDEISDSNINSTTPELNVCEATPETKAWISFPSKSQFLKGALLVVVIGGVTYILYRNGTFQKIADYTEENPEVVFGTVTTVAMIAGLVYWLKYRSVDEVQVLDPVPA